MWRVEKKNVKKCDFTSVKNVSWSRNVPNTLKNVENIKIWRCEKMWKNKNKCKKIEMGDMEWKIWKLAKTAKNGLRLWKIAENLRS